MASKFDRKVNQHFVAAKNVLHLSRQQTDKSVQQALHASTVFHMELAVSFYIHELAGSSAPVIAGPLEVNTFANVQSNNASASEFFALYGSPNSPLGKLLDWLIQLRTLESVSNNSLSGGIFKSDGVPAEPTADVIFSDKKSSTPLARDKTKSIKFNELSVTLDELIEFVDRQRVSSGEY